MTVDFFVHKLLARRLEEVLDQPERMQMLHSAARTTVVNQFELKRLMVPRCDAQFDDLVNGRSSERCSLCARPVPAASQRAT